MAEHESNDRRVDQDNERKRTHFLLDDIDDVGLQSQNKRLLISNQL